MVAGDGSGGNSTSKSKSLHELLERSRLGTVYSLIIMIMLMTKSCSGRKGYKIKSKNCSSYHQLQNQPQEVRLLSIFIVLP